MFVTKSFTFEAAHRLLYDNGLCQNIHGHSYRVEVCLQGRKHDSDGKVICFKEMNQIIKTWIDEHWDHAIILNSADWACIEFMCANNQRLFVFDDVEPTAENMAEFLSQQFKVQLYNDHRVNVHLVRVWETPTCCATWTATDTSETEERIGH